MAFGTAGLRAAMGVGFALIKDMTIIQSKQPYAVKRLGVAADVMVTASHNPKEDNGCKELSLRLAKRESAKIVMATDPDADGLGFAEQKVVVYLIQILSRWEVFTGNELAALLGWWMLFNWKETHSDLAATERVYMLATTASSKILKAFAWIEGFHFEVRFLCGSMVQDKDGVNAAVVVAEMASYLYNKNLTLHQQLENIFETYCYHISNTSYVICHDPPMVKSPHLSLVLPVTKSSQMITFTLQNGIVATLRTSGIEPNIKFYTEFCTPTGKSDISSLEEELKKVTDTLVKEFLEPDKNNLICQSF
nr:glucose 1,6-bisphosphate synthase-like [Oncorhynchus nerka]